MTGIALSSVVRCIDVDTYRDVRLRLYDILVLYRARSLSRAVRVILFTGEPAGTALESLFMRWPNINKQPLSRYESEKYVLCELAFLLHQPIRSAAP